MSLLVRKLVFALCAFATLTSFARADQSSPSDLSIAWEEGGLTLSYTVDPNLSTELQASTNLLEWGAADVFAQTISDKPDGTRLVKAVVSSAGAGTFFQLRRAPARRLTIAWDPAVDSSVAGYIIRLRRRGDIGMRRIDAGNATTATLVLPEDDGLYAFDVISYTAEGLESEPSNAITIQFENRV
jgi:hypothetical protein